jgi:hypothetical protein
VEQGSIWFKAESKSDGQLAKQLLATASVFEELLAENFL